MARAVRRIQAWRIIYPIAPPTAKAGGLGAVTDRALEFRQLLHCDSVNYSDPPTLRVKMCQGRVFEARYA
jgi:hypothetical protein